MKNSITTVLLSALLLAGLPFSASALSCMPPEMMFEDYVSDGQYTIVTATVIEGKDYITSESEQFEGRTNGYYGQLLRLDEVHKGTFSADEWVYFERDETWDYFCTAAPPEVGTEAVYIIRKSNSPWDLDMVSDVYRLDSELATGLMAEIEANEDVFAQEYTSSAQDQAEGLAREIRQLVHVIRIKLTEWRFWNSSE